MTDTPENSTLFVKHEYEKKPPKKRGSSVLKLAVCIAVAVVLALSSYAVVRFLPEKAENSSSTDQLRTIVFEAEEKNILSVNINNAAPFSVVPREEIDRKDDGTQTIHYVWRVDGLDEALIDTAAAADFISSFCLIDSMREMADKNGNYGLTRDTIVLKMRDGTDHTFRFGEKSVDGIGRYMSIDDDKVYVVEDHLAEKVEYKAEDLAELCIAEPISKEDNPDYVADNAIKGFDSVAISVKGKKTVTLTAEKTDDGFVYRMTTPKTADVAAEKIEPLLTVLQSGLEADGIYGYGIFKNNGETVSYERFCADADCVVTLKLESTEITLAINKRDDDYAVVRNGKNATYMISSDTAAQFLRSADEYLEN